MMKNNWVFILGMLIAISSCATKKAYLPSSDYVDVNTYGSYIKVKRQSTYTNVKGELIAIDSNSLLVLDEKSEQCVKIPISDVFEFKLRYANASQYGWTVPVAVVLPFMHGFFSVMTIPTHLIVTIVVTASGNRAYTYNNMAISYKELAMFARFPQGLPPDIDLSLIKSP